MRDTIYFELKKRIKVKSLSIIFTYVLLALKFFEYIIKKVTKKGSVTKVSMSTNEAIEHIEKCYPNLNVELQVVNSKTNPNIKCSVIVPIYNHEDVIKECLDSIFSQKCKYDFEVILVDDGSNNVTKEILKEYEKYNNCKIIHQKNTGIAAARNTGINNAVGQYIMFVDCDDTIECDMLQKLLEEADLKKSDIVFGAYDLIKESDKKVISVKNYIYPKSFLNKRTDESNIMVLPGYPWGKIYKRSLFDNIRFLPGYWYEDSIIQFLIYRKCSSFSYVPEVFYHYKWYENNFSKTQNSRANIRGVQRYWMLLQMIKISKEIGLPEDETFYITLIRHLGIYYYSNIKDFDSPTKEAMFVLACDLAEKFQIKNLKMNFVEKEIEKALLKRDYTMYELACKYQ